MIASDIIREIQEMLAAGGLSQRAIAERTGVSRGTVSAIAQGKRRDYPPRNFSTQFSFIPPAGRPARCPGCGGLVQMPCLACYLRQWKISRQIILPAATKKQNGSKTR
jgi:hypothetical protein